jgi:uncharacterized membrane protein YdjX (TVP38/TMEM64 family)
MTEPGSSPGAEPPEAEVLPAPHLPLATRGRVRVEVGEDGTQTEPPRAGRRLPLRLLGLAFIGVGVALALAVAEAGPAGLVAAGRAAGPWARLAVVAGVALLVPVFVPTGLLAVVPGYLWGPFEGTLWVLLGALLGGLLNLQLARRFLGRRLRRLLATRPELAVLASVVDARAFRILLGLRMSPIMPYGLLAYLAGLTRIAAWRFGVASILGGIPWTAVYATAGSVLAASAAQLGTEGVASDPHAALLRWLGLGLTIAIAVWIGRAVRGELARAGLERGGRR